MKTETNVSHELHSIFSTQLSIEIPTLDTDLLDTGLIDSLTMVDLLTHLENTYGFTVVMEDLDPEYFRTLQTIAEYVQRSCA
tara:strand:+ start:561 stop:806 length:246 start_codon:yes stop_codon:yes gene_type:complete